MHAVGKVGRVDDEAVFEGEELVGRTHDGITGMQRSFSGAIQ